MSAPQRFLIEGLDRLGKDTLIKGIMHRHGYYQVLHFVKPLELDCYVSQSRASALKEYQQASFRTLFEILCNSTNARIICNRAHLGECVYAPLYRCYLGEYVFDLERAFNVGALLGTRLILLTENFSASRHFHDDGQSLGRADQRRDEQDRFIAAFKQSAIRDKRMVCVTDPATGDFRAQSEILDESLA